jgi:hypothetical protein
MQQTTESEYWAASSRDEIANHILQKKDVYHKFLKNSRILDELLKSYSLFYGNSAIDELESGKAVMSINHYGSLIRSLHTLVTQNRPAFEARATNTDHKSQATTILANGLLDYYMREKKLENYLKDACLNALFLREGWITAEWNTQMGEVYGVDPDTNQAINEGDVEFNVYTILDIIRPLSGAQNWYIIRKMVNKYDLAVQFPEYESEILSATMTLADRRKWSLSYIADNESDVDNDNVELLTFYHAKTKALPEGRMVTSVGNTTITDGPLPYKRPYVFCIKTMGALQTTFGHSPAMDLIPMQDALDTCFSIALSNINSFGVGSLVSEKGTLQVNQIKDGLLHLEHSKGSNPPSVLNLLQIPGEIFNFAEMLIKNQETISSVNSVARGNPESQMSGTAMALVAQQTLTFSSGLQQSYNMLIEDVGSSLIELLQTYAQSPRVAQIAGKTKKSYMQEFSGQDLMGVSRIVVDSANAFTKTTGGKVEVANNLLQSGLITTPEQYLQVIDTGSLEVLVEGRTAQLTLIKSENEALSEGRPVQILMTDDDSLHVLEHSAILNDPEIRQDPNIMGPALQHIMDHINQGKTKDPVLSQMLKQVPMAPPMPPQQPGGEISQMPPQDMQTAPTPDMPTIAGTNQEFNPQGVQ